MDVDREPLIASGLENHYQRPETLRRHFARALNFAAGPAMLPFEVIEHAREELTDWRGSGMSIMEISHRSKTFLTVAQERESLLRDLADISAHYKVPFP